MEHLRDDSGRNIRAELSGSLPLLDNTRKNRLEGRCLAGMRATIRQRSGIFSY